MADLSRTTLVIVVVCASVVGLVVLFTIFKLILRSRNRHPTAPLPPVQPLAHHRATLYDTPLLYNNSRPTSTIPSSYSPNFAEDLAAPHLHPPIPTFPSSSESLNSSDSNLLSPSGTSSLSRPSPSSRPLSQASFASNGNLSVSRRTSRHTVRGVPHAPHSQVQIILPTPLAFSLQNPQSIHGGSYRDTDSDRISLVDKWVPTGRDDILNNTSAPSTPRTSRRLSSTSPSSYSYTQSHTPPPPVPQLYHTLPTPEIKDP